MMRARSDESLKVVAQLTPLSNQLMGGLQLTVGAAYLGVTLAVGDHVRIGHLPLELGEPALDLIDELLDHG